MKVYPDGGLAHHCFVCDSGNGATRFMRRDTDESTLLTFKKKGGEVVVLSDVKIPVIATPVSTPDDLLEFPDDTRYSEKYCRQIPLQDGTFFVRSPKGTGKTHQLVRLVEKARNNHKKVLLVGHRVNLLSAMAERLHLQFYKTVDWESKSGLSHLAICVDSLGRIATQSLMRRYDIVLIDESEQVLRHLGSRNGTISASRRSQITRTFYNIVKNAKQVVMLDADLSDVTFSCIEYIRGNEYCDGHDNHYLGESAPLNFYENRANLINLIERECRSGKSLFITTNSMAFVNAWSTYLDKIGIKHMAISSANSDTDEVKAYVKWLGEASDTDIDGHVVLVSPSLGTGVDIQASFDHVIGLFYASVNTHHDMDQQLYRVRNPKEVSVFVEKRRLHDEVDPKVIEKTLRMNNELTRELIEYTLKDTEENWFRFLIELNALITAHENRSKNRLRWNFRSMKEAQGWEIIDIPKYEEDDVNLNKLQKDQFEKYSALVIAADKIDLDEYEEMKKERRLSPDEKMSMERFTIEDFWRMDVEESPEIIKWTAARLDQRVIAHEEYTTDVEDLKIIDTGDVKRKHIIDRETRTLKKTVLESGLAILGIEDEDCEFIWMCDSKNVQEFIAWANQEAIRKIIESQLELKVDGIRAKERPMGVVTKFVSKTGMVMKKCGVTRAGNDSGTKKTIYQLDSENTEFLRKSILRRAS